MSAHDTQADSPYHWPEAHWRARVNTVRAGRRLCPPWPGGARAALALSFDCDHETFEMGGGRSAVGRLAWGEYGRRRGVPRILDTLERHAAPASFFIPAVSALIDPSEPRRIAAAGHEIGVHGWIHEVNGTLTPEEEAASLARSRDTLEEITGQRPVGHRAAHWDLSDATIRLVAEAGFLYDSSMMADDDPYELMTDGTPTGLVELPVDWHRDDAVYLLYNRTPPTRPTLTPEQVGDVFVAELDGARSEGGLCQLVMHPFVIGYRSRIGILDRVLRHARETGDVWIATHEQIARHAAQEMT
ncbi:polysaccharide deacetylase family protein [Pseudoponticoccus marisrubri]|uniref:Chitooligosaccharide deacetylase n=1 Tax=Pseudoponticoccus marisrubri TaxID=1685382 RepID=A0A0W7WK14_9RHOB|nr:polysaccharide deacetylase [Pseudoponticoccus marisrubri]KUF10957.1 polysaccharide deacetylase [Pseudoponticoccus marisrubri]